MGGMLRPAAALMICLPARFRLALGRAPTGRQERGSKATANWHELQVARRCRQATLVRTYDPKETLDVPQPARAHRDKSLTSEPFQSYFEVPVAGGALTVARAGAPPRAGEPVILVLHGMTSGHMAYRTVARHLCSISERICLLAPDLRGRGRSSHVPQFDGIATHIADMIGVLDHVGADRAIVVGHSMGCHIAARFAADHPERTAAVVLLDGGLPHLSAMPEGGGQVGAPGLLHRLETTYATVDEYLAYWRSHPALKTAWDDDIEAFARTDFVADEDGVRCVVNLTAVLADVASLTFDGSTRTSILRVQAPVRLMRAERGLYDDDPVIPLKKLEEFLPRHPHVSVEYVPDVNHYTLLMGGDHGPRRVAATLAELAAEHDLA
jgi:pimeloyl-ACP methyl ester carboxylesterase